MRALADVYLNRQAFPFDAHFAALRDMSAALAPAAVSPPPASSLPQARGLPPPAAIFVASDSTDLEAEVAAEAQRAPAAWAAALGLHAPLEGPPALLFVNQSARFIAPHGSHTVSSDGACSATGECSLPWEQVVSYRAELAKTGGWAAGGRAAAHEGRPPPHPGGTQASPATCA